MYITQNPRITEYKGYTFKANYKSQVTEEIAERDVIPYAPEILYCVDKNGLPFRLYSLVKIDETLINLFIKSGDMIFLGIEKNLDCTGTIEELEKRKQAETAELMHKWGYPTYHPVEQATQSAKIYPFQVKSNEIL